MRAIGTCCLTEKQSNKQHHQTMTTPYLFKEEFRQQNPFLERIPYHYNVGNVLSNLKFYISNKMERIDERLYVLFDYPGLGKTTTIVEASRETNSLYVQVSLPASASISSIEHSIEDQMNQYRLFSENQLLNIIESRFLAGLVAIFQNVYKIVKQNPNIFIVQIKENGISDDKPEKMLGIIASQVDSILNLCNKTIIVLHFDDCQHWSTPSTFTRQIDRDALTLLKSDIKNYYMIGLSKAVTRLPRKVFVALTGTNVSAVQRVRIDSGVKLYGETCLQYSNARILLNILKHFCNITLQDKQMLAELKYLEGSFRIFQYFLRILYENHGNDKAEILKISNLRNLIEKTYMEWKNNDLLVQLFNNSLLFENTLKEILFSALYPNFFLGKLVLYNAETKKITDYREDLIDNSLICVANFARNQFPDKWMKYHDIGLVRWKIVDNSYIMEPPFPFLIKLWCDHSAKYLFPSFGIEYLNSCLTTGVLATGVLGHAFQYAVALELTLPYSPLFKKILPNGYLPFSEQYRLETFTIDSQPNIASATIFYANDRPKPVISYDIITFINDMNGNAKKVLIQVKNDSNSTRCRESAKNLFRLDADVKVIISWHEHKLSSLAQDKCIVIEGSGQFTGTAIPFNFIFGNMSQISDHREIRNQLCKHPFFQNFLDPSPRNSPKRRKRYISEGKLSKRILSIFIAILTLNMTFITSILLSNDAITVQLLSLDNSSLFELSGIYLYCVIIL
jgi:hypothetical protein